MGNEIWNTEFTVPSDVNKKSINKFKWCASPLGFIEGTCLKCPVPFNNFGHSYVYDTLSKFIMTSNNWCMGNCVAVTICSSHNVCHVV